MKSTNSITIVPQAAVAVTNPETAAQGQAATCLNLRERERSLQAMGNPVQVATLQPADRLLLVTEQDEYVSLRGEGKIVINGQVLDIAGSQVLRANQVGQFIIVDCATGRIILHRNAAGGYERLNLADAVPQLHLAAVAVTTVSATIHAHTFATPLSQWAHPLPDAEVASLVTLVSQACEGASAAMATQGLLSGPVLARYGLRLFDDSYLWLSAPVLLGAETVATSLRARAMAVTDGGKYVGTSRATLQLLAFRVGISVASGIAAQWQPLIKAVDVLVTDPAATFSASTLDYRMGTSTTSGSRVQSIELGPTPLSAQVVASRLLSATSWHLAASTTSIAALSQGKFVSAQVSVNSTPVLPGVTAYALQGLGSHLPVTASLTLPVAAASAQHLPACSITLGSRLYSGGGSILYSNLWSTLPLFAGTISATPCTVRTLTTLATSQGPLVVSRTERLPFTPSALAPLICSPHEQATMQRIEVTPGGSGSTLVLQADLALCHEQAVAASLNATLQPRPLVAGTVEPDVTTPPIIPAPGLISISKIASPLALEWQFQVTAGQVLALAAAGRPIYNGGFGRYPLYCFTSVGVYALPQSTTGTYGEARLLSRKVINPAVPPADADGSVWFMSAQNQLCRATGAKVEAVLLLKNVTALAWNDVERELAILQEDGSMQLLMPSGRTVSRSLSPAQLWTDGIRSLAVMPGGEVLDLQQEQPAESVTVEWLSDPIELSPAMKAAPTRLQWNLCGTGLDVTLTLRAERGTSCHGFIVSQVHVQGTLGAPLALRLVPQPLRTVRLHLTGTMPSGTLLLPAHLQKLSK